jgi:NADH dehydrogenase [ubiquinone] 1 alpha subcomplex assembly factor 2
MSRIFFNMLSRKEAKGTESVKVGIDHLGNQYYEQQGAGIHQRRIGESETVVHGKRWYYPKGEDDWDEPIPPEWEAWLRYRRLEKPTEEEIYLNMAVAHVKKINAKKLQELEAGKVQLKEGNAKLNENDIKMETPKDALMEREKDDFKPDPCSPEFDIAAPQFRQFPRYDEYEEHPGGVTKKRLFGSKTGNEVEQSVNNQA